MATRKSRSRASSARSRPGSSTFCVRDLRLSPTDLVRAAHGPKDELPSPIRERQSHPRRGSAARCRSPLVNVRVPTRRCSINLEKIDAELSALTLQKDRQEDIIRVQMILAGNPSSEDKNLIISLLQGAPSLVIDGWLGPVITGTIQVDQLKTPGRGSSSSRPCAASALPTSTSIQVTVAGDNQRALDLIGPDRICTGAAFAARRSASPSSTPTFAAGKSSATPASFPRKRSTSIW